MIIQTAFIGDVILATGLVESIHAAQPDAVIDMVVRKGNEGLLREHPYIRHVFVWDKAKPKYRNLFRLVKEIRRERYDVLLNLQRFASTGLIALRARAAKKAGFKKNPLSFAFDVKAEHEIGRGKHEIERNFELLKSFGKFELQRPRLYPQEPDKKQVDAVQPASAYVVMAPSSVWFTKQLPATKWVELIQKIPVDQKVYLIGAPSDKELLDAIAQRSGSKSVVNLAGKLGLLASAWLMKGARMNYVNDSAPLHLSSAVNAPVTAYFCSTVPEFGFGPLSDQSRIVEVTEKLSCRPCGLHGFSGCPLGHFDCGTKIEITP